MTSYKDMSLGIPITIAIALHNIPEGIAIALPIYYATGSYRKALSNTFISGLAEPAGAILTFLIIKKIINNTILGLLYSLIAGIMLFISIEELLPTAKQYGNKKMVNIAFIIGIIFMFLLHTFL